MFSIASMLFTSALLIILVPITFHHVLAEALSPWVLTLWRLQLFSFTVETVIFPNYFFNCSSLNIGLLLYSVNRCQRALV